MLANLLTANIKPCSAIRLNSKTLISLSPTYLHHLPSYFVWNFRVSFVSPLKSNILFLYPVCMMMNMITVFQSTKKQCKPFIHATIWMDLKGIMLNEKKDNLKKLHSV